MNQKRNMIAFYRYKFEHIETEGLGGTHEKGIGCDPYNQHIVGNFFESDGFVGCGTNILSIGVVELRQLFW